MVFIPDSTTAVMDPFFAQPTLSLICDIVDAVTRQPYSRDPRYIARKAEQYLKQTGIGDTAYFGPEPEFFIFDDVRFSEGPNTSFYTIDSAEGRWNAGSAEGPNLGYKPAFKGGYFPVPPTDTLTDIRNEMSLTLEAVGHPGRGAPSRGRQRRSVRAVDALQLAWSRWPTGPCGTSTSSRTSPAATARSRRSCRSRSSATTARACTVTSRSGRTRRTSSPVTSTPVCRTWRSTTSAACSSTLPSFLAITNPGLNSYRRLVPGYEAPVNLAYSSRNRSASVRIPVSGASPKAKRLEFRCPDPTTNPYLAFPAMLMAGLDGIQTKANPGQPLDKDIYALSPEELKDVPKAPGSLEESIGNLRKNHTFLRKGDVFTQDVIDAWVDWKEENEIKPARLRPTTLEFALYFDN